MRFDQRNVKYAGSVISKHRLAEVAALIADPSRAAMLGALQDGRAQPAGALARAAGVSAATASAHLKKLRQFGLIIQNLSGRHHYYRLAGHEVNDALESLGRLIPKPARSVAAMTPERRALCEARLCYDHLAGALGVAIADALVAAKALKVSGEDFALTLGPRARVVFGKLDINVDELAAGARPLLRSCTDWTERREHLAGALGAALATAFLERGWVKRKPGSRALRITDPGHRFFKKQLRWAP